jgi:hypothetical protein
MGTEMTAPAITAIATFIIERPCDVGQDARPIHNGLFAPIPCGGDRPKNVPERLRHRYAGLDN